MKIDNDNNELKLALSLVRETNLSFFLTGKAGTGKSTFLRYIIETVSKNFLVVAPTGISAINIGGVTIHSFFQFPLRPLLPKDTDIKIFDKDSERRKIISNLDTLVIDEISMVRVDLIDGIDYSLRVNGGNPKLPFGGKQVIFVGDLFQLEPVTVKNSGDYNILKGIYKGVFFFNAKVFEKVKLLKIEFQKVYRQSEQDFISLLEKVRVKELSKSDLDKINDRVLSDLKEYENDFIITLTTRNDLADNVNSIKLAELKGSIYNYNAEIFDDFEVSKYPTDPQLSLKVGAQIIFLKNDIAKRWTNGTIGQVCELSNNEIKVKLKNELIYSVEKRVWENVKYKYNRNTGKIEQKIVGTFKQYPLKLAWSITIHKSQGLTFDKLIVDFGNGTFSSGQAYVALSRAKNFNGLFLKNVISFHDINVNEDVKKFYRSIDDISNISETLDIERDTYILIKKGNHDNVARRYLKGANKLIVKQRYKEAYHYLISGFNYLICDCMIYLAVPDDFSKVTFKNISYGYAENYMYFLIAYVFWIKRDYELALNNINTYIKGAENEEIGYYLKGRIYSLIKDFKNERICYSKALEREKTNRSLYRLGRLKEERFNENGIAELYEASLDDVLSHGGAWLAKCSLKRGKLLKEESSYYVNIFNKGGELFYLHGYEFSAGDKIISDNNNQLNFTIEKNKLKKALIENSKLFLSENIKCINYEYYVNEINNINLEISESEWTGPDDSFNEVLLNTKFHQYPENYWNISESDYYHMRYNVFLEFCEHNYNIPECLENYGLVFVSPFILDYLQYSYNFFEFELYYRTYSKYLKDFDYDLGFIEFSKEYYLMTFTSDYNYTLERYWDLSANYSPFFFHGSFEHLDDEYYRNNYLIYNQDNGVYNDTIDSLIDCIFDDYFWYLY
ncbi:DEAD/DEAH box helicase [Pedobacter glucosidilyticus]|uniref:DEAD/DEAH box helicase n=1 Tax=Pedobacter glucosidilyticus TaxID=1122941 RepID=UPI000427A6AD|nr:DEAD/DEAH box helicase [Pedobacter glucosidilyticus]